MWESNKRKVEGGGDLKGAGRGKRDLLRGIRGRVKANEGFLQGENGCKICAHIYPNGPRTRETGFCTC